MEVCRPCAFFQVREKEQSEVCGWKIAFPSWEKAIASLRGPIAFPGSTKKHA